MLGRWSRRQASRALLNGNTTRLLRTGKGRNRRPVEEAFDAAPEAPKPKPKPSKPQRAVTVPPFIRARTLAKALGVSVDRVFDKVVYRRDRKLHMVIGSERWQFDNVKNVIFPFDIADAIVDRLGARTDYDEVEPTFSSLAENHETGWVTRDPVIAVLGHEDHGKTTLLDALRGTNVRKREANGITQTIHVCETSLDEGRSATFLDTPGQFHFFRMRSSAAQLADVVVLVVAADEGCCLQTEEAIGAAEEAELPVVVAINKVDLVSDESVMESLKQELREYVALEDSPMVEISAKDGKDLDKLMTAIKEASDQSSVQNRLRARGDSKAEGVVLESRKQPGKGHALKVLVKHGVLKEKNHFAAGMIHGVVRSLWDAQGERVKEGVAGKVVEVVYANKSKNKDAPIEAGFFALEEKRAMQVVEQRELQKELEESVVSTGNANDVEEEAQEEVQEGMQEGVQEDLEVVEELDVNDMKVVLVKADGGISLASIQDTVDEMPSILTAKIGIGNVSVNDIDTAFEHKCPIYAFNVKLLKREAKYAASRGVQVHIYSQVHELLDDVERLQGDNQSESK